MSKANRKYQKASKFTDRSNINPVNRNPACARQTPRTEGEIKFHAPRRSKAGVDKAGRTI